MAVELNQHIEVITDNPLDAKIAGKNTKVYIVAQFALAETPEITAEQFNLTLGAVYAALSFYTDNKRAILSAIDDDVTALGQFGMVDSDDAIAKLKQKMNDSEA